MKNHLVPGLTEIQNFQNPKEKKGISKNHSRLRRKNLLRLDLTGQKKLKYQNHLNKKLVTALFG